VGGDAARRTDRLDAVSVLPSPGVENIAALQHLILYNKVVYEFPFFQREFDALVPVLVLSEGRSLFKVGGRRRCASPHRMAVRADRSSFPSRSRCSRTLTFAPFSRHQVTCALPVMAADTATWNETLLSLTDTSLNRLRYIVHRARYRDVFVIDDEHAQVRLPL
jgi:hypothetical protein